MPNPKNIDFIMTYKTKKQKKKDRKLDVPYPSNYVFPNTISQNEILS